MTLVIGHRDGWMVADRRTTFGRQLAPIVTNKVVRLGQWALLGSAGSSVIPDLLREDFRGWDGPGLADPARPLVKTVQKSLHRLRDIGPDHGGTVLVSAPEFGVFCWVNHCGCISVLRPQQSWWAIGSGEEIAYGWMARAERRPAEGCGMLAEAIECIEYAGEIVNDVGGGVQVERLVG